VKVKGSWFPRSINGRAMALCAYIRCVLMAIAICCESWRNGAYDVVIVDQVSVAVLIIRAFSRSKVLFYCHFPDLLLASPKGALHKMYRIPLNALEQWSTGAAHSILVNSEFTKSIFSETFTRLAKRGIEPYVLYPAVKIPEESVLEDMKLKWRESLPKDVVTMIEDGPVFVSINRFERKKNIGLAIKALQYLHADGKKKDPCLIVAGGYDVRLAENVEHLEELRSLAKELHVDHRVSFLPSFTDEQRLALLVNAVAVLYTPTNEHFGIVPVEAMASETPVIACNSGGPLESIGTKEQIGEHRAGFLVEPIATEFAKAMKSCVDPNASRLMGKHARKRAIDNFSRHAFGNTLNAIVLQLVQK